jgi:integrase
MPILTDVFVRGLSPPDHGNRIHWDAGDPKKAIVGFGCRITEKGARSFVLRYYIAGRERRLTIGSCPTWGVGAAREEAKRLLRDIDRGGYDPLAERVRDREAPTVNDLCTRYLAEHAAVRKGVRSRIEDERLIRQWIKPELGNRKVGEIRRSDVEKLHRKISERTPTRANRCKTLLSTMFSLVVRWEMRADNPASGVQKNYEEPRHRYLTGDELRRLTEALAALPNQQAANVVRLLLLTGSRRGETLAATWSQFDLEQGIWTKPSSHTKQKKLHRIPLSAPARLLLAEMRAAAQHPTYLFPERGGDKPISDVKRAWETIRKTAQIDARLHDLRHSYASILASAGLSLPVIGALLGHTQPGTTARYAHLFDDPLRAATEKAGEVISGNGDKPGTAEVIAINRR